jgi:hypothetical protein
MHLKFSAVLGIFALAALSPAAQAGTTYNTSLASPPGVYFGTGNANSNFTVDTGSNVEIGLSAITRFIAPITPTTDVYTVPLGNTALPNTGSAWGVDFSINLRAGGGSLTLSQIDPVLVVTDTGTGFNEAIPDFTAGLGGNTCYDGSVDAACSSPSDYGIQNSEPGSLLSALGDAFNDAVADTYDFTLYVYGCSGADCTTNLLASDTIVVNAVPEPASIYLLGAALLGFGGLRQLRKNRSDRSFPC